MLLDDHKLKANREVASLDTPVISPSMWLPSATSENKVGPQCLLPSDA